MVWFQKQAKVNPALGVIGRAVQTATRPLEFTRFWKFFKDMALGI
jgi:hypothetical protein